MSTATATKLNSLDPNLWHPIKSFPEGETVDLWLVPLMPHTSIALGVRVCDCFWNEKITADRPRQGWIRLCPFTGKWHYVERKCEDGTQWKAVAWRWRPPVPPAYA